jgi:hypothetical protein
VLDGVGNRRFYLVGDFVGRPIAVEDGNRLPPAEILEDRLGAVGINLKTLANDPLLVVVTSARRESSDDLVGVHDKRNYNQLSARRDHRFERRGLLDRARKSVEHKTSCRIRFPQPLTDETNHQIIADERAALQAVFYQPAQFGAVLNGLAEHVAGRDFGHAVSSRKPIGLRAFAGAGRAEQHDVQWDRVRHRTKDSRVHAPQ